MEDIRFKSMKDEVKNVDKFWDKMWEEMKKVIGIEIGNRCLVREDFDEKGLLKWDVRKEYKIEEDDEEVENFEDWVESMLDDGSGGLCYDCEWYKERNCRVKKLYKIYNKMFNIRYKLFNKVLKDDID